MTNKQTKFEDSRPNRSLVIDRKPSIDRQTDRRTDRPTDRLTDRHVQSNIPPLFSKGGYKYCSRSLDAAFNGASSKLGLHFIFLCLTILIGKIIVLINSIIFFLKASIILNVKVVQNDFFFKFGGERVKKN